jgi:hypothetical protein
MEGLRTGDEYAEIQGTQKGHIGAHACEPMSPSPAAVLGTVRRRKEPQESAPGASAASCRI